MFINMEARLAEYRASKAQVKQTKQSPLQSIKLFVQKILKPCDEYIFDGTFQNKLKEEERSVDSKSQETRFSLTQRKNCKPSSESSEEPDSDSNKEIIDHPQIKPERSVYDWILLASKFLMWALFIELQFGAVYFTISLIVFIYFNTRTGPKDNKLSAYSVFNKECERIHGTLTAEQLQKNMFSVPGLPLPS